MDSLDSLGRPLMEKGNILSRVVSRLAEGMDSLDKAGKVANFATFIIFLFRRRLAVRRLGVDGARDD